MKKFTFILFAVLLAVVPQHSQAYSLGELLESAQQKTKAIIDDALFRAEELIANVKEEASHLGEQLRNRVTEVLHKVEKQMEELLQKINGEVNEIIGDREDPNLSECRRLAGTVLDTALTVVANETHCITEKLETGKVYIANITVVANEVTGQLRELQTEARQCTEGVNGIKTTIEAIACVNKIALRAVWISMKRVPEVTAGVVKLGFFVNTLPITLPQCAAKNGFNTLAENVDALLSGVKQCVKDRMGGNKHHPQVTEAPKITLPTTTEVTETPEVTTTTTTEVTEAPEATSTTTTEVTEAPEATSTTTTEVTEAPEATSTTTTEVTEAPEATSTTTTEVTEAPEATSTTTTEVNEAPEVTSTTTTEVTETPEVTSITTSEVTDLPKVEEFPTTETV